MSALQTSKKLLLEMVPVFLAVFLAYQVNEYRDYRKEQENLEEAVKNIRMEMLANKQQADTSAYFHYDMLERLKQIREDRSQPNFEGYVNFMHFLTTFSPKKKNLALPQLSNISFEAAKRKHAVSSMDYETINKIAAVYVNMEEGVKSTQRILLQALSDPDVIALTDFDRTFNLIYGSVQELHSQERYLSKQIEVTLEHMDSKFASK